MTYQLTEFKTWLNADEQRKRSMHWDKLISRMEHMGLDQWIITGRQQAQNQLALPVTLSVVEQWIAEVDAERERERESKIYHSVKEP